MIRELNNVVMDLIKMECEVDPFDLLYDNTYKLEENKSSSEEDLLDVDRVEQEEKLEISSEEDEVLTERIATSSKKNASEFGSIAHEENAKLCQIPNHSDTSEEPVRTRDGEKHAGKNPFKCDICGKVVSKSFSLKRHKRLHIGEKPFKCVCAQRFSQKSSLKDVSSSTQARTHSNAIFVVRFSPNRFA
ncbi:zinc finger protein 732-like isoform X3 [Periplaneta americana]|uniref:zinc finger protein 732-like isoform X3 n=1 Tax=Periplaneta americana TaxID=6978 RepID=UPI0037E775C3